MYPHGVGTSGDHIALSSKSVEMFFSRSNDRNAISYERMGYAYLDFIDESPCVYLVKTLV